MPHIPIFDTVTDAQDWLDDHAVVMKSAYAARQWHVWLYLGGAVVERTGESFFAAFSAAVAALDSLR